MVGESVKEIVMLRILDAGKAYYVLKTVILRYPNILQSYIYTDIGLDIQDMPHWYTQFTFTRVT